MLNANVNQVKLGNVGGAILSLNYKVKLFRFQFLSSNGKDISVSVSFYSVYRKLSPLPFLPSATNAQVSSATKPETTLSSKGPF
ncbi:hypothetical protein VNO77_29258 [Canavalia gladiata]|uniref:Uncharacterized protein n=1 Tax=Canavalia gladiata TaxID=3824 RepID=A0AAN9KZ74_CANGL